MDHLMHVDPAQTPTELHEPATRAAQREPDPEIREALVVKPGDRLLVRVHPHVRAEQVDVLRERLLDRFPDIEVTVITCEQIAVVRD